MDQKYASFFSPFITEWDAHCCISVWFVENLKQSCSLSLDNWKKHASVGTKDAAAADRDSYRLLLPTRKRHNRPLEGRREAGLAQLANAAGARSCCELQPGDKTKKIHTPEQLMQTEPHVRQKQETRVASEQSEAAGEGSEASSGARLIRGRKIAGIQLSWPQQPHPACQGRKTKAGTPAPRQVSLLSSCAAGGGTETPTGGVWRPLTHA